MATNLVSARPIRIIPFDLGRQLDEPDIEIINKYIKSKYKVKNISARQSSILKDCFLSFELGNDTIGFLYTKGIFVVEIIEPKMYFDDKYEQFSIEYGENRKHAHKLLFEWEHGKSSLIFHVLNELWAIVRKNSYKEEIKLSANEAFENKGLSYIMTLSMFEVPSEVCGTIGFKGYPKWLKNNLFALLESSVLYLEDSSRFESVSDCEFDVRKILEEISYENEPKDYENHRHLDTYMSWAAVVIIGQIQNIDIEEYAALEVQLQSDWYYVYCMDKNLKKDGNLGKKDIFKYQQQSHEIDLLENRLYDFDDPSMPTRILDIQKGLVNTSGLHDNIQHVQRKIKYIIEREKLNTELRQKN